MEISWIFITSFPISRSRAWSCTEETGVIVVTDLRCSELREASISYQSICIYRTCKRYVRISRREWLIENRLSHICAKLRIFCVRPFVYHIRVMPSFSIMMLQFLNCKFRPNYYKNNIVIIF